MDTLQALAALDRFIEQRPGFDISDYGGNYQAMRNDYQASVLRPRKKARKLMREALWRTPGPHLEQCFKSAFSGRVSYNEEQDCIRYIAGQYMPTEYIWAAIAVLEMYLNYYPKEV